MSEKCGVAKFECQKNEARGDVQMSEKEAPALLSTVDDRLFLVIIARRVKEVVIHTILVVILIALLDCGLDTGMPTHAILCK